MNIRYSAILLLAIVIITGIIGVTGAVVIPDPGNVTASEVVNTSAVDTDAVENQTGKNVSATINWVDKTTVSGKIRNFFKGFSYKSGITI